MGRKMGQEKKPEGAGYGMPPQLERAGVTYKDLCKVRGEQWRQRHMGCFSQVCVPFSQQEKPQHNIN